MKQFLYMFWFVALANFIELQMARAGLIKCVDFVDIDKNLPNGENMGGLTQTLIYGKWDDVLTWPAEPDPETSTIEQYATLSADLVMKPGKRAFGLYSTEDTASLVFNQVGEVDGISYEAELDVFHPGMQKKILGFMGAVKNDNLFFIAQDGEGQYYLLGDKKRSVKMIAGDGITTGKATSDRKGANLKFKWKTNVPRVYEGDVTNILNVSSGSS